MRKKIAITGANGFLGMHTIEKAIRNKWDVVAVVRREAALRKVENLGATGKIACLNDEKKLEVIFREVDAVIHLAGIVSPEQGNFEEINVNGTRSVINAAEKAHIYRLITPSGLGVSQYGIKDWATNDYFYSKKRIEELLDNSSLSHVIFRPSYIIGPNDELIPMLVEQMFSGTITIVGTGKVPMQPIYVGDVTDIFLTAITTEHLNKNIYDLVGNRILNMLELVQLAEKILRRLNNNVPEISYTFLNAYEAVEAIGLSKEEIDVMFADELGNPNPIQSDFLQKPLKPIKKAIEEAIIKELDN
jgi:nucleoside-diphosphate-sugar epimerase